MIVWPGLRRSMGTRAGIPIANRAAHFDASLGITSSGGFASAWADQSGNGRNLLQATGANQPIHLPFAGTKYGWLPGVAGNYFSTPDSAAASITGDIDIRVKVALNDYTPTVENVFVCKNDAANNMAYYWILNGAGTLSFITSTDGTAAVSATSTASTGITDGAVSWIRVTRDVDNGAGGNTTVFYKSSDGVTWTKIGADVVNVGTTSIYDSAAPLALGMDDRFNAYILNGKIYRAQIYNGIDGTLAVDFDASRYAGGTTLTGSTGETWTINSTGSKPAQIVDRPSLLFDGAAHYMKCAAFTLNQPETVYLVAKQISWTINEYFFDGNTGGTMSLVQDDLGASPGLEIYAGTRVRTLSSVAIGEKSVITSVFNGASSLLQKNNGTPVTGDAGLSNAGGFTVGATGIGTSPSNIQVYEALIYNVAHDAATRANVIRALMSKHGVTT